MQRQLSPSPKFEGKHADLSEKIIRVFYDVHNELGFGFSERVFQKAFAIALREVGMEVEEQVPMRVYYHGQLVGEYFGDVVVNKIILLELKAASQIIPEHEAQLLSYLKASEIEVGYVLNFGKSATFKRMVLDNERKGNLRWTKQK